MSDAERVYEMVERRKERAKGLGLPKTAFDLYCELTRWYPESAKNTPGFIPESVSDMQRKDKDVEFSNEADRYAYQWREDHSVIAEGKVFRSAHLELLVNGRRVFGLGVSGSPTVSQFDYVFWIPRVVESFVEGPWVKTITALAAEVDRLRDEAIKAQERQRREEEVRQREDPEHLAELQERFGIDLAQLPTAESPKTPWWKWILNR